MSRSTFGTLTLCNTIFILSFLALPIFSLHDAHAATNARDNSIDDSRFNYVAYDYDGAVLIGQPWLRASGKPMSTRQCLEGFTFSDSAITSSYSGRQVRNTSDARSAFGISANASATFLAGKVTAKASFAKEVNVSHTTSTFIGHARAMKTRTLQVEGPTQQIQSAGISGGYAALQLGSDQFFSAGMLNNLPSEVKLTKEARNKLRQSRKAFEDYCGDGYVIQIFGGAEAYGYLSLSEVSKEVKQAADAMMTGSSATYAAGVDAYKKASATHSSGKTSSEFMMDGGAGGSIQAVSIESFFTAAANIRKSAEERAAPRRVGVASYATIPECNDSPNCPSFGSDADAVLMRAFQIDSLESTLVQIDDLITHDRAAYATDRTAIDAVSLRDQVVRRLAQLKDNTRECLSGEEQLCRVDGSNTEALKVAYEYQLQIPLGYEGYPRQHEYELSVADYKKESVARTHEILRKQVCDRYFARDSQYCQDAMETEKRMNAEAPGVIAIRASTKGFRDEGDPYRNQLEKKCLQFPANSEKVNTNLFLGSCSKAIKAKRSNQIFGYKNDALTSYAGLCVQKNAKRMTLASCSKSVPQQRFVYTKKGQLRYAGYCISSSLDYEICAPGNRFVWVRRSK